MLCIHSSAIPPTTDHLPRHQVTKGQRDTWTHRRLHMPVPAPDDCPEGYLLSEPTQSITLAVRIAYPFPIWSDASLLYCLYLASLLLRCGACLQARSHLSPVDLMPTCQDNQNTPGVANYSRGTSDKNRGEILVMRGPVTKVCCQWDLRT